MRREFIAFLGGAAVVWSLAARAQQTGKVARVGVLALGVAVSAKDLAISAELARMGYVDARNIAYETRAADVHEATCCYEQCSRSAATICWG